MEIITFFIIIPMFVAFIANNSMQTPFGAIIAAGVVAFFAFIGGKYAHHLPAELDAYDKFYHVYGICCDEKGHCRSCFTQYAERFRYGHEFDGQFKQAFAK
ncbi:hypothetical protein EDB82DRAFT_505650 [Fusarium venenatum]|uniref:uncharacterized protein n=1 Tax=Fusarium venenatum TaxID=56646 RepID=UPI001DC7EC2B|nr:hypothetical protein EDB82DRAFT_505650 [Fusarium venenatum]